MTVISCFDKTRKIRQHYQKIKAEFNTFQRIKVVAHGIAILRAKYRLITMMFKCYLTFCCFVLIIAVCCIIIYNILAFLNLIARGKEIIVDSNLDKIMYYKQKTAYICFKD